MLDPRAVLPSLIEFHFDTPFSWAVAYAVSLLVLAYGVWSGWRNATGPVDPKTGKESPPTRDDADPAGGALRRASSPSFSTSGCPARSRPRRPSERRARACRSTPTVCLLMAGFVAAVAGLGPARRAGLGRGGGHSPPQRIPGPGAVGVPRRGRGQQGALHARQLARITRGAGVGHRRSHALPRAARRRAWSSTGGSSAPPSPCGGSAGSGSCPSFAWRTSSPPPSRWGRPSVGWVASAPAAAGATRRVTHLPWAVRFPGAGRGPRPLRPRHRNTQSLSFSSQVQDTKTWVIESTGQVFHQAVPGAVRVSDWAARHGTTLPIHPTQLYESLAQLLLFTGLMIARSYKRFHGRDLRPLSDGLRGHPLGGGGLPGRHRAGQARRIPPPARLRTGWPRRFLPRRGGTSPSASSSPWECSPPAWRSTSTVRGTVQPLPAARPAPNPPERRGGQGASAVGGPPTGATCAARRSPEILTRDVAASTRPAQVEAARGEPQSLHPHRRQGAGRGGGACWRRR